MKQQMLEEEVRNLKKTIEALTAERDQLYERWNDCQEKRMAAVARAEAAESERDALTAENRRLREALEGAESWLDRWATHVGNIDVVSHGCAGGEFCTCGLTFVRYETSATLKGDRNE